MPTLIARLRKRPAETPSANQPFQSHASPATTPIRRTMPGAWSEMSPFERKIHPDLNSLIIDNAEPELVADSSTTSCGREDKALGFIPLPPSTRKRSASLRIYLAEDAGENAQALEQPSSDVNGQATQRRSINETPGERVHGKNSPSINASSPNTSGETFGGGEKLMSRHDENESTSRVVTDTRSTPVTPDTSCSLTGAEETRIQTPNISSGPQDVASSPHTFGIPTPPSSGFTFGPRHRRIRASIETPPPLPPLDHPAFQSSVLNSSRAVRIFSAPSLLLREDEQEPKQPRHAWSLPSMSHKVLSSTKSRKHSTKRGRSRSRVKVQEIFSSTRSTARSFQHSRTQSKDSIISSRRDSAEFSAAQAALIRDGNDTTESWEVQVSREIVRMSLGGKPRPGYRSNAGVGEPRGCNSIKAPLGSPFLLQHTHNTPADNNTSGSNLVSFWDKGECNLATMSKDDTLSPSSVGGQGKSKSSERTRTPSPPPPKLSTIPYPGPEAPSTSHLMPPSLSFTAPTPQASPISPIRRTRHQQSATEPPQSTSKSSTPVRSTSSGHRGKRKADEAGVEGNTPPKDQPRATFALEPRPHRASAGSGSSRAAGSASSRAPSSYHRKRAKLSTTPESRPGSRASVDVQNAANTGSLSSKGSSLRMPQPPRSLPATYQQAHRDPSRRSLSMTSVPGSIPMSALISPHAPSIPGSSVFHMRDPRKPPPIQSTPWSLSLPSSGGGGSWLERGGSPLHAWLFFVGFVMFPIWWVAAFVGIPRTRRLGGNELEKGVVLDDPQVEFDANSWRKRCRIMAAASLFTYIPFVVLVAIFAR